MEFSRKINNKTKLENKVIERRISLQLKNLGYKIINKTDRVFGFIDDNETAIFRSRLNTFSKIDSGKIEIEIFGENRMVNLTYKTSATGETVIIPLLLLGGFIWNRFLLIFTALIAIQFLIKFFATKNTAKKLMVGILSGEDNDN